jgi:hypothetical protein
MEEISEYNTVSDCSHVNMSSTIRNKFGEFRGVLSVDMKDVDTFTGYEEYHLVLWSVTPRTINAQSDASHSSVHTFRTCIKSLYAE